MATWLLGGNRVTPVKPVALPPAQPGCGSEDVTGERPRPRAGPPKVLQSSPAPRARKSPSLFSGRQ